MMTKEEIIEMSIQARLVERIDECHRAIRPKWIEDHDITTYVEAFAKLVAEKEREALEVELLKMKQGVASKSDYIQGRWDLIGEFQDIIRARSKT